MNDLGSVKHQHRSWWFGAICKLVIILVLITSGNAQNTPALTTICSFVGWNGEQPFAPVVQRNGVFYGTTFLGGTGGVGTVFSLTPPSSPGNSWTQSVLYNFTGGSDGGEPTAGLLIGSSGVMYGTTTIGGNNGGAVFRLAPPKSPGGAWTQSVIYNFAGSSTGYDPTTPLVQIGKTLYGTTRYGGTGPNAGYGTVFSLTPSGSGGPWTEAVLHSFTGVDGSEPTGVMVGANGVLYGTTGVGGPGNGGTIYSLTPPVSQGGAWSSAIVHSFAGADGSGPWAPPVIGAGGILYGTTTYGGSAAAGCPIGCGVVYSMKPPAVSGGAWTGQTLYMFTGGDDGANPFGRLTLGSNGELYGTTSDGAGGNGTVWELVPAGDGTWNMTALYRFQGSDGDAPYAGVLRATNGTLYGTTYLGGVGGAGCPSGCGTVFRLKP
jgi:uncharacterized repeat protein (TIGR03803 family)